MRQKNLRTILLTGAGVSGLALLLTGYVSAAALLVWLSASWLVNALAAWPVYAGTALGVYLTIMVLLIALQTVQIIRRDHEAKLRDALELDLHNVELTLHERSK